jgi:hypothetical protein
VGWVHERERSRLHWSFLHVLVVLSQVLKIARRGAPRLRSGQEVPGFAVLFPAGALAGDVGVETEAGAVLENLGGQDVPDVERDDVGYQNVDIFGGVNDFAFAVDTVDGLDVVAAGAQDLGAFELYTPEAGAGIEDEIVALAVSPRFGDAEAQGSGFEHEGGLGEFSGALGVGVDEGAKV